MSKTTPKPPEARGRWGADSPSRPSDPADRCLDLRLQPPQPCDNNILLCEPPDCGMVHIGGFHIHGWLKQWMWNPRVQRADSKEPKHLWILFFFSPPNNPSLLYAQYPTHTSGLPASHPSPHSPEPWQDLWAPPRGIGKTWPVTSVIRVGRDKSTLASHSYCIRLNWDQRGYWSHRTRRQREM